MAINETKFHVRGRLRTCVRTVHLVCLFSFLRVLQNLNKTQLIPYLVNSCRYTLVPIVKGNFGENLSSVIKVNNTDNTVDLKEIGFTKIIEKVSINVCKL